MKLSEISIFDFINAINEKHYIFSEENAKKFNAFITIKAFSYFPDTLLLANEANRLALQGKECFDFLYYTIPRKKRRSQWYKTVDDESIDAIAEYFEVCSQKAKDYAKILDDNDIEGIKNKLKKGGITK